MLKIICALKSKYVKLLTTQYKRLTNCFLNVYREETPYWSMFEIVTKRRRRATARKKETGHKVTLVINTKLTLTYLAVSHIVLMVKKRLPIKPHFSRRAT